MKNVQIFWKNCIISRKLYKIFKRLRNFRESFKESLGAIFFRKYTLLEKLARKLGNFEVWNNNFNRICKIRGLKLVKKEITMLSKVSRKFWEYLRKFFLNVEKFWLNFKKIFGLKNFF